ncbi:hypothetical protein ACEWY4_019307 [Coilia grayii]|uniref:SCAN box domain-containing protein n=1 Tax=Coilia grayii TaxID=363190 RepID=A0ABD1JFM1_9TELE
MEVQRLVREEEAEETGLEEELRGAEGGEPDAKEAEPEEVLSVGADLTGLYALLQNNLKAQEREAFKQEQRWRSVQIQLNQLREEVDRLPAAPQPAAPQPQPAAPPGPLPLLPQPSGLSPLLPQLPVLPASPSPSTGGDAPVAWSKAAIPKYVEGDIEQYLTTFERLARGYRWPMVRWAVYLVPYLTEKARNAYVAMDINESMDYAKVKEAILQKYEINEEVYRRRFREPDIRQGESPRELYQRLKDMFRKWIRPEEKTVEEVAEVLILEQFIRTLLPEVRVWVKEHKPQTGQQAAELVENFLAARRGPKLFCLIIQRGM